MADNEKAACFVKKACRFLYEDDEYCKGDPIVVDADEYKDWSHYLQLDEYFEPEDEDTKEDTEEQE